MNFAWSIEKPKQVNAKLFERLTYPAGLPLAIALPIGISLHLINKIVELSAGMLDLQETFSEYLVEFDAVEFFLPAGPRVELY